MKLIVEESRSTDSSVLFWIWCVCNNFHKKLFRGHEMNLNFCMNLLTQENNENEPLFTSGSALMGLKFWREGYFPDARGGWLS